MAAMADPATIADAVPFRFGGHVALDFVNTVDSWVRPAERDYICDFGKLVAWEHQVGLIDRKTALKLLRTAKAEAQDVHRQAIRLRQMLFDIFEAIIAKGQPGPIDLNALNQYLSEARSEEVLVAGRSGFEFRWNGAATQRSLLHRVAIAVAELLTEHDLTRLKHCPGPDGCGWLFYDESRNRSRRWCSMDYCGSFAKARRFAEAHGRGK